MRQLALERGITVITPMPRLKGAFRVLDPARIPRRHYAEAATLKRGGKWGADVTLAQLPKVDLVVMGSVAVTRDGRRLGKGHGYADLEYALLRELGNLAVPLATTVHELQVVDAFPVEAHDTPLTLIATPGEVIEVKRRRRARSTTCRCSPSLEDVAAKIITHFAQSSSGSGLPRVSGRKGALRSPRT